VGLNQKGIKILQLNVCHLSNKFDELKNTILCNKPMIDICGFTESFLTNITPDACLNVDGYNMYRKDRVTRAGGGIIVYVSEKWNIIRRDELESEELETMWLEITFSKSKSLFLCYVYRPPNSPVTWFDSFGDQLERAAQFNCETILIGDFNIDAMSNNASRIYDQWNDIININNFTQVVTEPTRITERTSTIIDHIYVQNTEHVKEVLVPQISVSDHFAVCLTWKKRGFYNNSAKFITYRNMNKFNENMFIDDLNNNIFTHLNDDSNCVNDLVTDLTNNFTSILDKHAPLKEKRIKHITQPIWFNNKIKECILARDRAKRKGQTAQYKKLRNNVVNMVKKAKMAHYHKVINESKGKSRDLWKHMGELRGKTKDKGPSVISIDNELCSDPHKITNSFNKYFTNIANDILQGQTNLKDPTEYKPPPCLQDFIDNNLPRGTRFSIPKVTEGQMKKSLNSVNVNKSTGLDSMSAKFLRIATPVLARHLCKVINISISTGVFPDLWKHAKIIPIYKSGKCTDMNNYRPISILAILSKIIESHVHNAFYEFLCSFNLISIHQSGFRKNHSCETGLAALISKWHRHIDNNDMIGCINIDLRKAFDLINHDILLKKLKIYGCDALTVAWFTSYLKDRKQAVFIERTLSSMSYINHGVPQGSILGPLLFVLFINDLPLALKYSFIHMYADDTSLYVIGKDLNEINRMLNSELINVSEWFSHNNLVINETKTNCMLICTQQRRSLLLDSNLTIFINGSVISNVESQTVLGITIDNSLKFDIHVANVCKKLSSLVYLFCKIRNYLTLEAKLAFYNSYLLPNMEYCITTWGYSSKTNLDKLYVFQKRIGRLILNDFVCSSDVLFANLKWLNIHERLDLLTAKLVHKCLFEEAPESLKELFVLRNNTRDAPLRNTGIDLTLPLARTEFRKKCFEFAGAATWNKLPATIRQCTNSLNFKLLAKNFIISRR
jgi:hypothetical protein